MILVSILRVKRLILRLIVTTFTSIRLLVNSKSIMVRIQSAFNGTHSKENSLGSKSSS